MINSHLKTFHIIYRNFWINKQSGIHAAPEV